MSPIDIFTELIICILPIYIIKRVQVSFRKKLTVVVAFSFRILCVKSGHQTVSTRYLLTPADLGMSLV